MQNPHLLRRMTSTIKKKPCCPPHCKLRPAGAESPESYEVTWHQAVGICIWLLSLPHLKRLKRKESTAEHRILLFYFHDEDVMFGTKQKRSLRVNMSKPYNTRDDSPATSVFTPVAELTTSTQDLTMESTTQLWHFGTWASWAEACI